MTLYHLAHLIGWAAIGLATGLLLGGALVAGVCG